MYIVNIEWFTSYLRTRCCIKTMQLIQKITNLIQTNKFILQFFCNTFPFMNRFNKETNKICWKCWRKLRPWLKSPKMLQTNLIMYMKETTSHRPTSCFFLLILSFEQYEIHGCFDSIKIYFKLIGNLDWWSFMQVID